MFWVLLSLLPALAASLQCSQCQELTVDGHYYSSEPRACSLPQNVTCGPAEDACISAGVRFLVSSGPGQGTARVEFSLKYCGQRTVSCEQIEKEMTRGVDYGNLTQFDCFIGTKCGADLCNRWIPGRIPSFTTPYLPSSTWDPVNLVEQFADFDEPGDQIKTNGGGSESGIFGLIICVFFHIFTS